MLVLRQDVEAEPRPRVPHVRPPNMPDLQEEAHAQARAQGVGVQGCVHHAFPMADTGPRVILK